MTIQNTNWKPTDLSEYIGQELLVRELAVEIHSSIKERRALNHMVFHGGAGVGKNTLIDIIAKSRGLGPPVRVPGKSLKDHDCLTELMCSLGSKRVGRILEMPKGYNPETGLLVDPSKATFPILVIDEAECVETPIWELLHQALEPESSGLRWMLGQKTEGGKKKQWNVWVVDFTMILLTNYFGKLMRKASATLSRMPIQHAFEYYSTDELQAVVTQFAKHVGLTIDEPAADMIARRSHGEPRRAVNYVRRVVGYSNSDHNISLLSARKMFETIGVDSNGFDRTQITYMKALVEAGGGPLGIEAISVILNTQRDTVELTVEPALLRKGMVMRSQDGRVITSEGRVAISGAGAASPFYSRAIR